MISDPCRIGGGTHSECAGARQDCACECHDEPAPRAAERNIKCSHSDKQWRLSENNPADVMCEYDYIAMGTTRKHAGQIIAEHNTHATLVEQRDRALVALKGVAIMLNTNLSSYDDEPWAQRVRAAITIIEQSVRNAGEGGRR